MCSQHHMHAHNNEMIAYNNIFGPVWCGEQKPNGTRKFIQCDSANLVHICFCSFAFPQNINSWKFDFLHGVARTRSFSPPNPAEHLSSIFAASEMFLVSVVDRTPIPNMCALFAESEWRLSAAAHASGSIS